MKNLLLPFKLILFLLVIAGLNSCMQPLYFPNSINAPAFSKQGQFVINGAVDVHNAGNIQLASAAGKKLALLMNYNWGKIEVNSTSTSNSSGFSFLSYSKSRHTHSFFETGAGYYKTFGETGRYEAFGLIGFGSAESYVDNLIKSADYRRFVIQNDIGFESKNVEGLFSFRLGYLDMTGTYRTEELKNLSSMFFDPAFTLKVGWPKFKIFGQLGFAIPFDDSVSEWVDGWLNFGFQGRF